MNWSDEGIILSVRPHGETAAVVELFTRGIGRHLGLVHGGRGRRLRPVLQTGNHVDAQWKGRLSEHLGQFKLELRRGYAASVMSERTALAGLSTMCELTRLLPERDPHANLFEVFLFVLGFMDDASVWPSLMVRWELALLQELGFGLDLKACASSGDNDNLIYVSPRTGRAVSASAGEPYKDRLLALPQFLVSGGAVATRADISAGFALTGHFLQTRVLHPIERDLPEVRARLLGYLEKAF